MFVHQHKCREQYPGQVTEGDVQQATDRRAEGARHMPGRASFRMATIPLANTISGGASSKYLSVSESGMAKSSQRKIIIGQLDGPACHAGGVATNLRAMDHTARRVVPWPVVP